MIHISTPDDRDCGMSEGELCKLINDFLRGLEAETRIIFVRRYWYLEQIADIAARLGISVGKVKSVLFRTRKKLSEYLQERGVEL